MNQDLKEANNNINKTGVLLDSKRKNFLNP